MKLVFIILTGTFLLSAGCAEQSEFKAGSPTKGVIKASDAKPEEEPAAPPVQEPELSPQVIVNDEAELAEVEVEVDEPLPPLTLEVILPSDEIKAGRVNIQAKAIPSRETDSEVIWSVEPASDGSDVGSIDANGVYTSPASANSEVTVTISATLESDPTVKASKQLKIIPEATLFVGCKRGSSVFPITAEVYSIPVNSSKLPDYAQIPDRKQTTVCMDKYDVPTRDFTAGFPEIPDLFEWFSLHTKTKIVISAAGQYKFRLLSDDGANLYIDGRKVIDNDGTHSPRSRDGAVNLSQGEHELVLDYYQGPRTQIALQLFWATPDNSDFVIVPAQVFRP